MIGNINGNGKSNIYDYVNLIRYLVLVVVSISIGYTISDFNPEVLALFHRFDVQFASIFLLLVSGLLKFKNNKFWKRQIFVFLVLSYLFTHMLQSLKRTTI